jgi:hypothetical protein
VTPLASNPMPRLRFILRVVLVGVTLFALFVGLSQWRNRYIRGEAESLAKSGCEVFTRVDASDPLEVPGVGLSEGWIDGIWQRRPNRGNIMATDLGNDSLRLGQELVSRDEFEMKLLSLQRRLEFLGVERIFVLIDGQAPLLPARVAHGFQATLGYDRLLGRHRLAHIRSRQ